MEHILSLSYGKDSLACLGALDQLGWPLDRIIHAEVWATDTIQADLPPMVEFKAKADKIIKERWGIEVEHLCATRNGEKLTYEKLFYHIPKRKTKDFPKQLEREDCRPAKAWWRMWRKPVHSNDQPCEFPYTVGSWCKKLKDGSYPRLPHHQGELVYQQISNAMFPADPLARGSKKNIMQYLGIAADEPERIERHSKPGFLMPLVEIGWDEAYCRKWCEENDLLSPIYTSATRGGCWFCHNQGVDQLRLLRKNYPDLWELLLKWDLDSPTRFKADGHTVHDFDERFRLEDEGLIKAGEKFRWKMLEDGGVNYRLF